MDVTRAQVWMLAAGAVAFGLLVGAAIGGGWAVHLLTGGGWADRIESDLAKLTGRARP